MNTRSPREVFVGMYTMLWRLTLSPIRIMPSMMTPVRTETWISNPGLLTDYDIVPGLEPIPDGDIHE